MISEMTKQAIKKIFIVKKKMEEFFPILGPFYEMSNLLSLPHSIYDLNKLRNLVDPSNTAEFNQENTFFYTCLFNDYPEFKEFSNDQFLNAIRVFTRCTGRSNKDFLTEPFDSDNDMHCMQLLSNLKKNNRTEELVILNSLGADRKETTDSLENDIAKSFGKETNSLAWLSARAVGQNMFPTNKLDDLSRNMVLGAGKFVGHKRKYANFAEMPTKSKAKAKNEPTLESPTKRQRMTVTGQ
ncbi:hypothetical protein [Candidatus Berkiella aquae]|uniref:Uncharacterized protein n=1 Tax=Candidatus Berkiella aquae TaxID=295108 RepID=A0A0Q9Z134_9GAMM|nr:hypothetical protein [Candidatus Berkiella aquae]MCS5711848.1 hypothetical protein [Candidatus Berkiella aquae]